MNRTRRAACMLSAAALAVSLVGVQIAGSRGPEPLDLAIAKEKQGPYKSGVQDDDPPDGNPQLQTRRVKDGKAGTYFVRLKNPNQNDDGTYLTGDPGDSDYNVKYKVGGADVTEEVTDSACPQFILGANQKLLFTMKIKPTGAEPGDQAFFGVTTIDSLCTDPKDSVYAKVKVIAP